MTKTHEPQAPYEVEESVENASTMLGAGYDHLPGEQDYVIVNGKILITRWQKCIKCGREVFTSEPPEETICEECSSINEAPYNKPKVKEHIPESLRWEVWERDNFTCKKCGSRRYLTIDHIYPRSLGGRATIDNCQTLCRKCNSSKGAK
jgi:HNH endonuclease